MTQLQKALKPLSEIVNSFEQGILISYSGALYKGLNSWLRNKKVSEAFYREYTSAKLSRLSMCLASAINRLAAYQGVSSKFEAYRGAFLDRTAIERYKKGAILPEIGFQSYSLNKNVALSFSGAGQADDPTRQSVLFVLKSTKPFGANLEGISSFSDEENEIHFSTDHNYCVDNVTDQSLSKITNNQAQGDASVRVIQLVLGTESCGT
jgi:hypothetical protein